MKTIKEVINEWAEFKLERNNILFPKQMRENEIEVERERQSLLCWLSNFVEKENLSPYFIKFLEGR